MLDLANDIHSLTDFKRNTTDFVRQMKKTGNPLVLTVNGKAELIVQDAQSYQKLLEMLDRAEAIEGIRRGLESMKRGHGRPAEDVFNALRKKYKIPR
jgi:prevent-host-death family protein